MSAGNLVSGEIKSNSTTPRTDGLIARVMARHSGQSARAQADYYEDVHQDLAPLARQMEAEIIDLVKALQGLLSLPHNAEWVGQVKNDIGTATPYGQKFLDALAALAKAGVK